MGRKNRPGRSKREALFPYRRRMQKGRNPAQGCDPFRYFSGNSPGNLSPGVLFPESARAREFQADARLTRIIRLMPVRIGKYLARGCKRRRSKALLRPATLLLLFPAKPAASRAVLQSVPNPDSLRPYSIFLGKSRYGSMHFTNLASHFRPDLRNSPT